MAGNTALAAIQIRRESVFTPFSAVYSLNIKFLPTILNILNAELIPICHMLALLGAHHILYVSRI